MTYFFQCDGQRSCTNTNTDEHYCDKDPFVCNNEEYVSNVLIKICIKQWTAFGKNRWNLRKRKGWENEKDESQKIVNESLLTWQFQYSCTANS